ncbi:hypothetical protein D3C77_515080 [compost metagenome]
MSNRVLKVWNGRSYYCHNRNDPKWEGACPGRTSGHVYAAAYSRADLRRMITEYAGLPISDYELKVYWSEGNWGDEMEGIAPERGLWLKQKAYDNRRPVRLV